VTRSQLDPLLQVLCNTAKQCSGKYVFQEENINLLTSETGSSKMETLSR